MCENASLTVFSSASRTSLSSWAALSPRFALMRRTSASSMALACASMSALCYAIRPSRTEYRCSSASLFGSITSLSCASAAAS